MTATVTRRYCIKVKPYLSLDTLVRHQKAKAVRNHPTEIIIIYMSFSLSKFMVIKVKVGEWYVLKDSNLQPTA
tara:strand:+ start:443 stop:661 length:219 start_codon:yes stop_codon:yes gene_type:complete